MRVAFLYNRSADDPANAAEDDVPSRSPVVAALRRLGHRVVSIACSLNLASVRRRLERANPDVAFNRVESLGGSDAMMAAMTLLLDAMQIPYTGCSTAALVATASKVAVKERLLRAGLPTPEWVTTDDSKRAGSSSTPAVGRNSSDAGVEDDPARSDSIGDNFRYILKSDLEHASFEINDASIVGPATDLEIAELVRQTSERFQRPFFAERFIDGREFNLSVMGDPPRVLPPAEIDFSAFPEGKPKIVGYGAKWDNESFEFHNTPRHFEFPATDRALLSRLIELTAECSRLFDLRGYARVDFRCDAAGQPWILEINSNPCIAPTSGFAAALEQFGIGYDGGIQQILDDALTRGATLNRERQPGGGRIIESRHHELPTPR